MTQWQKIISDLKGKGLTQKHIATNIGCSQNYISNLEHGVCGKRISYDLGKNLEKLWNEHHSAQTTV